MHRVQVVRHRHVQVIQEQSWWHKSSAQLGQQYGGELGSDCLGVYTGVVGKCMQEVEQALEGEANVKKKD